jgi:hypothetical protein
MQLACRLKNIGRLNGLTDDMELSTRVLPEDAELLNGGVRPKVEDSSLAGKASDGWLDNFNQKAASFVVLVNSVKGSDGILKEFRTSLEVLIPVLFCVLDDFKLRNVVHRCAAKCGTLGRWVHHNTNWVRQRISLAIRILETHFFSPTMPRVLNAGPNSYDASDWSYPKDGEEPRLLHYKTQVARRSPVPYHKRFVSPDTPSFSQQTAMEFDGVDQDDEDVVYVTTVPKPTAPPVVLKPAPVMKDGKPFFKRPAGRPPRGCFWNFDVGRYEVQPDIEETPPPPKKRALEVDEDEPLASLAAVPKKVCSLQVRPVAVLEDQEELLCCLECGKMFPVEDFVENLCEGCDDDWNCLKPGDVVFFYEGIFKYGDARDKQEGAIVKLHPKSLRTDGKIAFGQEPFMELSNGYILSQDTFITKIKNRVGNSFRDVDVTKKASDFKMTDGELSERYIERHGLYEWKKKRRQMLDAVRMEVRDIAGDLAR